MLNCSLPISFRSRCSVVFFLIFVLLSAANFASAKGQGPIGLWSASNRYVLVADKSLTGLVLVDLLTGTATERLLMSGVKPKGVASCPNCDFALVSGSGGKIWRVQFKGNVSELLEQTGKLGLDKAQFEPLELEHADGKLTDGRMIRISDDGSEAFIASSEDHAVFRVDFSATPNALAIFRSKKAKPFGINWDKNGDLLVSMHKRSVWRISTDGAVLATYNVRIAGCPGAIELKPNLRAAIDDPVNANSLLILASNPKSYDAVIWRLTFDDEGKQSCAIAAGKIGHDPGWVDATGDTIEFSRPHYFVLRPDSQPAQLIVSDIDNRALRLLNLETDTSTTVMYDRDRRIQALPSEELMSAVSCAGQKWPDSVSATAPSGNQSCARPPKSEALELTLREAKAHCEAEGARLCESTELRSTGVATKLTAWTSMKCASCWHRNAGEHCAAEIDTHKTKGIVHGHKDFSQSWNSGHALEISAESGNGPATLCSSSDSGLRAATPCCADE